MAPKPKCIECRKDVKEQEKDGSISCCQCDRWIHTGCTTLSQALVKELRSIHEISGRHFWACEGCTSAFSNLTKRMTVFEKDMAELKLTVNNNKESIKEVSEKVDKVTETVKEDMKKRKDQNCDLIAEATKKMSAELRERESRKNNLVLYGLWEPPQEVKGRDRKEGDLESVGDLFEAMSARVDVKEDIKFSYRLGPLTDKVYDDPRPMCIGFHKTEVKDMLLMKAKNISKTQHFYNVSMAPDLTAQQRAEDKALVKEAEDKNKAMSEEDQENWIFRCIGPKGQRTIARLRVDQGGRGPPRTGRGPARETPAYRGRPRQRPPQETPFTGGNSEPMRPRNRYHNPPPPGVSSDEEEGFNGYPTIEQGARTKKRIASTSPVTSPNSYPNRQNQKQRRRGGGPSSLHYGAGIL